MKTLIIFLLMIYPIILSSQNELSPKYGDNTIRIKSFDNPIETIKEVLLVNGYQVDDKSDEYISTRYKPSKGGGIASNDFSVSLFFLVKNDSIEIYGLYRFSANNFDGTLGGQHFFNKRAEYNRNPRAFTSSAFEQVEYISKKLSKELTYYKQ